jgi:hypothetical protein
MNTSERLRSAHLDIDEVTVSVPMSMAISHAIEMCSFSFKFYIVQIGKDMHVDIKLST